ncbi:MAG: type II secretion system protein [Planctomycetota bacterium]|nr:type II secretion system protein [Planctomycetota bacterium]
MRLGLSQCSATSHRVRRAFSLMEVLVVIAIIAVLIAVLIPGLSRCKFLSRQARELSTARQLMLAVALYADDSKGAILPGYAPISWVNGQMVVRDEEGNRLMGDVAQRYPWRLAPYLNYEFRGLYENSRVLEDIRARRDEYAPLGVDERYVMSLFPSLGMNTTFVGGTDRLNQFSSSWVSAFGDVVVDRMDEATRPTQVMAFTSARVEQQPLLPALGRVDGFFRVEPPYLGPDARPRWEAAYDPQAPTTNANSGNVALRGNESAVASMLDGHAATLKWDELRDMRRWADAATRADWLLTRR